MHNCRPQEGLFGLKEWLDEGFYPEGFFAGGGPQMALDEYGIPAMVNAAYRRRTHHTTTIVRSGGGGADWNSPGVHFAAGLNGHHPVRWGWAIVASLAWQAMRLLHYT